jgi:phage/plasmid-associated DNA primase
METELKVLLERYFTKDGVKLYLPLKCVNGDAIKGGKANMSLEEFIRLSKGERVMCKFTDKNKKVINYPYTFQDNYKDARAFELNLNSIEETIIIIDIDDEEISPDREIPELIRNLPYTLSRNRKLPHYWCILEGIPKETLRDKTKIVTNCLTFCKGDIIASHVWESSSTCIYNYSGELPTIPFNSLESYIKRKFLPRFHDIETYIKLEKEETSYVSTDEEETSEKDTNKTTPVVLLNAMHANKLKPEELLEEQVNKVIKLSECMRDEWMSDYANWRNYTILFKSHFGDNYKNVWDSICKRFTGYNFESNMRIWDSLNIGNHKNPLTYSSFFYWAKQNNLEKFDSLNWGGIDWNRLTETMFAEKMYELYFKDKLIFCGKEKVPNGYYYNGVYWVELGAGLCLLKKKHFKHLYDYYKAELEKVSDDFEPKQKRCIERQLLNLDKKVVHERIIGLLIEEHWIDEKEIVWNGNPNLFVFENAIYDLELGMFIESSPSQYINYSCGYKFLFDRADNGSIVSRNFPEEKKNIINFIKSILGCEENDTDRNSVTNKEFSYLMKVLASFLKQNNSEEVAYFLLGEGRNGKGTLTTLLQNTLGQYWGELNIEYYTAYDKGVDTPNQSLYNCRNARVLNTSEVPENNNGDRIHFIGNRFKNITGGDQIKARELGSKNVAYFKAGHIWIQTNLLPLFHNLDTSIHARIVILCFRFIFTDNRELLENNRDKYKQIDRTLKSKFNREEYKLAFIQLLFEYYELYKTEGLIIPESINNNKEEYIKLSSDIKEWFFLNYKKDSINVEIELNTIIELLKLDGFEKVTAKSLAKELSNIENFSMGKGCSLVRRNTGKYYLKGWVKKEPNDFLPFPLLPL